MSVLSLGSTKAEFDAFLNDTYGIANNELTVKQAKSEATSAGNAWGDLCAAWGQEPTALVTLRAILRQLKHQAAAAPSPAL